MTGNFIYIVESVENYLMLYFDYYANKIVENLVNCSTIKLYMRVK